MKDHLFVNDEMQMVRSKMKVIMLAGLPRPKIPKITDMTVLSKSMKKRNEFVNYMLTLCIPMDLETELHERNHVN